MRCRTKEGTLRLYYGGDYHMLDPNGMDVPNEVAESIRGHVNVIVGGAAKASEAEEPDTRKARKAAKE